MRRPLQGVVQIVRFNWPLYALGSATGCLAWALAATLPSGTWTQRLAYGAAAAATFWVCASLAASWMVYDRSPLARGDWIPGALGFLPNSWIVVNAGFDELTPALRNVLAGSSGRTFDVYDPDAMTEPSIARARRAAAGSVQAEPADARRLPLPDGSVEAALVPLSAHELRTHDARRSLFRELNRVLTRDGRVIVAEHLRDAANFAAFGPGFLHFHSRREWVRCFSTAGFTIWREFPITPFVRVFVLGRLP